MKLPNRRAGVFCGLDQCGNCLVPGSNGLLGTNGLENVTRKQLAAHDLAHSSGSITEPWPLVTADRPLPQHKAGRRAYISIIYVMCSCIVTACESCESCDRIQDRLSFADGRLPHSSSCIMPLFAHRSQTQHPSASIDPHRI